MELRAVFTDFLPPDFCLNIGERRNCRSVNLSPRRSFLLREEEKVKGDSERFWNNEKRRHNVNIRVQRGFLVVHHHGAAPLASLNRRGALGTRGARPAAGELATHCGGQIGHITQTQAPPCCPDTVITCREVNQNVITKGERWGYSRRVRMWSSRQSQRCDKSPQSCQ